MRLIRLLLAAVLLAFGCAVFAEDDTQRHAAWIEAMKAAERGPFERIRWFCKDGQVLPPESYACKPFGGGAQHGEWSERTRELRDAGYAVATFYTDLDIDAFLGLDGWRDLLGQMLVEQYLIRADDGWILRRARYYRGAYQVEGERRGKRRLLFRLAERPEMLDHRFLLLRTAARLLEHGEDTASVQEVRQLSATLARSDTGFVPLRNKIHAQPEAVDAVAVRRYAAGADVAADPAELERLAALIDAVYADDGPDVFAMLAVEASVLEPLGAALERARAGLAADDALSRFVASAELLAALREHVTLPNGSLSRMAIVDASLAVETLHFRAAASLAGSLPSMSRQARLALLGAGAEAVYGVGLLSARQRDALRAELETVGDGTVALDQWRRALGYLALAPTWGSQALRFQFGPAVEKLGAIEPVAPLFLQDHLRGSPLFFYADVVDGLIRDANRLAGVRNALFGEDVGGGLRALNPGLARGRLHTGAREHDAFSRTGIYLLPETIAELPPVAGILTAGEGNPLSHIQLLARNLGIPNVGVDERLHPLLSEHDGAAVVLAVSPGGSVQLAADGVDWEPYFPRPGEDPDAVVISPDLDKLELDFRRLATLTELRSDDSGRSVGPKAAKLGELRHHYPEAVAEGLAIPFGIFRGLLEQQHADGGTVFDWMVANYRRLESLPEGSAERERETEAFREALEAWVLGVDPGAAFWGELEARMREVFGPDGSYGVFVRSDTNVEDLPGFTGAGLNLTVANVVGFDAVRDAIVRVWASPFTARAFAWRQALMDRPEHVYPAVLLMLSVNAEKSGVLVTREIDTGEPGWISVAVNEGVGGAVDGQSAESLRVRLADGHVRLMAQATAPLRRQVNLSGGVTKLPASGADYVLKPAEIAELVAFAKALPTRFPPITDADGEPAPADVEFGFLNGALKLFQIRPFLESRQARGSEFLRSLDKGAGALSSIQVDLDGVPR